MGWRLNTARRRKFRGPGIFPLAERGENIDQRTPFEKPESTSVATVFFIDKWSENPLCYQSEIGSSVSPENP